MKLFEILENFIFQEGEHDPYNNKAIFMAGIPGAGKTWVANKIFVWRGLRPVNIDQFSEMRIKKGEDYEKTYKKDSELTKKRMNLLIKQRIGIVLDFTNRDVDRVAKVNSFLKQNDYDTALVFVDAPIDEAYERTLKREEMLGRKVSKEYFEQTVESMRKNILKLESLFRPYFFVVYNSEKETKPGKRLEDVEKKIHHFLKN